MRDLTDKQRAILTSIASQIHNHGRPPTLRELCEEFNIRSTNGMNDHLKAIEKKGYIVRSELSRGIKLTPLGALDNPTEDDNIAMFRNGSIYSTAAMLLDIVPNNLGNKAIRDGLLRIMRIVSGDEDHALFASQATPRALCKGTERKS